VIPDSETKPKVRFIWPTDTEPASYAPLDCDSPEPVALNPSEPRWKIRSQERAADITKYRKAAADLRDSNANEADTRMLVTDVLTDILGYDKYEDLTTEYRVRGDFADYGIKINGTLIGFVEVKRAGSKLAERHMRQVEMYSINQGTEWMILTNGWHWKVYHLTAGLPMVVDLVLDFSIVDDEPETIAEALQLISIESLQRLEIEKVWVKQAATNDYQLRRALNSTNVQEAMRLELWRNTGHKVSNDEVGQLLARLVGAE
jgi:predicted type IV restriction endonuclease